MGKLIAFIVHPGCDHSVGGCQNWCNILGKGRKCLRSCQNRCRKKPISIATGAPIAPYVLVLGLGAPGHLPWSKCRCNRTRYLQIIFARKNIKKSVQYSGKRPSVSVQLSKQLPRMPFFLAKLQFDEAVDQSKAPLQTMLRPYCIYQGAICHVWSSGLEVTW